VLERGGEQAGGVQLLYAAVPAAGVDGVAFQPGQGVRDGGVMTGADLLGDLTGGDGPQRGHALDRGEGQVEPGHRAGRLTGVAGDERGQLARVLRRPAVLLGEHGPTDVGADLGPLGGGQRPVLRRPSQCVDLRAAAGHLDPERRRGVHHRKRLPEPDRSRDILHSGRPGACPVHQLAGNGVRVRMLSLPEQGSQLVGAHRVSGLQVDVGQG